MATAPYDIVNTILDTARVRLNDAIQSIDGDVLTDNQPFTKQFTNAAWRRLQEYLVDLGFARFTRETTITGLPAAAGSIGSQVSLSWTGYNGGGSPSLPQDLISPLELWERVNGSNTTFVPVDQVYNGLPTVTKDVLNRIWEWRDESIFMPGATGATDLRIRYAAYLADFEDNTPLPSTPWFNQKVPLMRCLNPFAWLVCAEVAKSRGDLDAGYFDQKAQEAAMMIYNRDPAAPRQPFKPSEFGKMPDRYTPSRNPVDSKRGPE